jgi:hypothetical protein
MRAIEYDTNEECVKSWNELEELVKHLHEKGTDKYTYIENNVLILDVIEKYEPIVAKWIGKKETINFEYKNVDEI